MDDLIIAALDGVLNIIAEQLGLSFWDKHKAKKKIKEILKNDSLTIRQFFQYHTENQIKLIENYIYSKAFINMEFYSIESLNEDEENELWYDYSEYMRKETNNGYVDKNDRDNLIYCLNKHNKRISDTFLGTDSKIQMQKDQHNHYSIMKEIRNIQDTLVSNTKLQSDNISLDYLNIQIESILKSVRLDLIQRRKLQSIYLVGVLLIAIMNFSIYKGINMVVYQDIEFSVTISLFSILLFSIVIIKFLYKLWRDVTQTIYNLEQRIEQYTDKLWEIHFNLYEKSINIHSQLAVQLPLKTE